MGVKAFKFASPGIFLNEIDQSQLPTEPAPVGPIIIGRAQRGPAMRPVTVASYEEFVQTFGEPVAGPSSNNDVWRAGIPSGPTYGGYAAQAWLANNPTVTFVRLLGVQSETYVNSGVNNAGAAGWTVGTPSATGNGGAYGLFIFPSSSNGSANLTGALAAVWYCSGTVPVLSGTIYGASTQQANNGLLINSDDSGVFTVQLSGTATNGLGIDKGLKKTFNFNPTSGQFIRKVFNTNPQNVNPKTSNTDTGLSSTNYNYYGYWLGETFENDVFNNMYSSSVQVGSATTKTAGIIMPLNNFGSARLNYEAEGDYVARTGWVVSQAAAGIVPNYNPATTAIKLFRFLALDGGDWIRNNLKITINNIAAPQNDAQKYGTFDVEIRSANDTDANKKIVESYVGCDLNPSSPNYIARRIGDTKYSWDDTTRKLTQVGNYPNNSKFVRVEMYSDDLDSSLIPFGVLGPMKYVNTAFATVGEVGTGRGFLLGTSSCFAATASTNFTASGPTAQNFLFTFPSLRQRVSSSEDSLTTYTLADWGAATTRGTTSILYNDGINDLLRVPVSGTAGFATGVADGTALTYAWTFSLDEVRITGSALTSGSWTNKTYIYVSGSKGSSTASSYTATGSANGGGDYTQLLADGVNSFTTVFQGGFDGFNILEGEPLRNSAMTSNSTNDNSYIYYTYRRAIDTVRDSEEVEGNLLTIPGLTFEPLTNYELQIAEQRGDIMAVVDASQTSNLASYVTKYEKNDDNYTSDRVATVDTMVTNMKARNLNSSYGATYYPWVQISDSTTGKIINVPPSIVAVGAMSYTDKVQAPWFAPAGFNRGGLSTGNAGVNVVNVVKKLSQADRDKLYPVNINPIASFPNEGIVIFGQKTLQATPSALDRINVRRLMLYIKRGINLISKRVLFEPNVENTWNNFKDQADPFLADVKARFGLTDYKLILDNTTTTPDLIDQNIMYAKIFLKPARAIEYIAIDFFITKTGANFNA